MTALFSQFPAGEVHAKDLHYDAHPGIMHVPFNASDEEEVSLNDWIFKILMATDIKRRAGHKFDLFLPYLPYSRQDRVTSLLEPFALKVLGDILNAQEYRQIYTLDVHSDVAGACIENLVNIPVDFMVLHQVPDLSDKILVVPDQGASKRLYKLGVDFKGKVTAIKHRDTATGMLSIEAVCGEVAGEDCLIVDDICDGGGTFVLLAEELRKRGAASVDLFVTHGIFSKGVELEGIDRIYTTNSYRDLTPEGWEHVTVIDAMEVLRNYVK